MSVPSILIIKTSSLGDVVHNLPIVADIRARIPDARIDWVVEEPFAEVPALHPQVTRVLPVAMRRWRKSLFARSTWHEIAALRHALRNQRYDHVLDTQGLLKSAVIARWANGPVVGQDAASVRERVAAWFYDQTFHVVRGQHAVVRNRDLAAQALGYAPPETPPDYGLRVPADAVLVSRLPARFCVCLHATSWPSKRWPESSWIELGGRIAAAGLVSLFPWGNAEERARAERIASQVPGAVVPAKLTLRELAVVLDRAVGVIGVDTGLVHLSAALARPTVAIYIDSSPQLTGLLPPDAARAVSLGGKGQVPAISEVWRALARLRIV
ncbi:MAG: lipopolysaccharide heptosyltransferase I [Sulfurifustis sp.]